MSAGRAAAGAALVLSLIVLAGCSGTKTPQTTPTTPAPPTAVPTSPAPTPTDGGAPVAEEATCESIIPDSVVREYLEIGWTAKADIFRIGQLELPDGIHCTWGDYSVATDHVQVFGWAQIDAPDAAAAQTDLIQNGWRREDGDDGVYVTESSETAIAPDDEGYGFTYFFGEGFVTLADTKQGLLLIEAPRG